MLSKYSNKGISIIELLIIFCMMISLTAIAFFLSKMILEKGNKTNCTANLRQLGSGMHLYWAGVGRKFYPDTNGAGFLTRLYQTEHIIDSKLYLCPSTKDTNNKQELHNLLAEETTSNICSYAGRMNKNWQIYPGLFQISKETSHTSIASDDFNQPSDTKNHSDSAQFLFLDGHTQDISYKNSNFQSMSDPLHN